MCSSSFPKQAQDAMILCVFSLEVYTQNLKVCLSNMENRKQIEKLDLCKNPFCIQNVLKTKFYILSRSYYMLLWPIHLSHAAKNLKQRLIAPRTQRCCITEFRAVVDIRTVCTDPTGPHRLSPSDTIFGRITVCEEVISTLSPPISASPSYASICRLQKEAGGWFHLRGCCTVQPC